MPPGTGRLVWKNVLNFRGRKELEFDHTRYDTSSRFLRSAKRNLCLMIWKATDHEEASVGLLDTFLETTV